MNDRLWKQAENYIYKFNREDEENVIQLISNAQVADWMKENIPLIDIPDKQLEEKYYFRFWTLRKHIKQTPDGMIFTEFHPDVDWAGKYNAISCAAGHHIREARWLKNTSYVDDYINFWYKACEVKDRQLYSQWIGSAVYDKCMLSGDYSIAEELLPYMVDDYKKWEENNQHESGLFYSVDDADGMEFSISGNGLRATLNSYMIAYAQTIAKLAARIGNEKLQKEYSEKAAVLKNLMQEKMYDKESGFFKTIPLSGKEAPVESWNLQSIPPEKNVNELWGLFPWYFGIPDAGMEIGWGRLLKNLNGFFCCCGLTTAENSHSRFLFEHPHECLWNGYSWPFATSMTLSSMARLLRDYEQDHIDKEGFYKILSLYAYSHRLVKDDGTTVNWIDESLDPRTGEWYSRKLLKLRGFMPLYGGYERGKDYNHSTYCDIILGDLLGIQPKEDHLEIHPLIPDSWDYYKVCGVLYNGHELDMEYSAAEGLQIMENGKTLYVGKDFPIQLKL